MKIYGSVSEIVGNTPLLRLSAIEKKYSAEAVIAAKLEYLNPAGSIKDRTALSIIEGAEKSGRLKPGGTIIEPTSGNTGIGLAALCASRGYKLIITIPDSMSRERQLLMRAYGASVILTDGKLGMKGAIQKAEELAVSTPGSIIAGQFTNPDNPAAHYKTTGPEIMKDTDGKVSALIAGIGTGGTVSGAGKYLKEKDPGIKVIGVEPESSPFITKGVSGRHGIQGIGAGFIPDTLDTGVIDEVIAVSDDDAFSFTGELAKEEGILAGISSGAALAAAVRVSRRTEFKGGIIVVIFPDTGDRYLSSGVFG